MSKINYSMKGFDETKMARARLNNIEASFKISIEIANMLRYKTTTRAKTLMNEVIALKTAVPYKRFNMDVAHKKGIGPGRFPVKPAKQMLALIKLAEANAANKGLGSDLKIIHLAANKGTTQWHHGRQSRRQMKACHIEIAVCEKDFAKAKRQEALNPKPKVDKVETKTPVNEKKTAKSSKKDPEAN